MSDDKVTNTVSELSPIAEPEESSVTWRITVWVIIVTFDGGVYVIGKERVSGFKAASVQPTHCCPSACDSRPNDEDEPIEGLVIGDDVEEIDEAESIMLAGAL